jgi:steroid delta-isomerase-like uncharacterized protein
MSEENKALSRRVLEEAFSQGNFDVLDEVVAEDAQDHDTQNPFRDERGPAAAKKSISIYREAFPDLTFTVEDQIAEGDKVVSRWIAVGTNDGEMMGVPATGKQTTVTGIAIDRIQDGRIVETWVNWDTLGMMQQLGLVPEQAAAAS